MGLREGRRNFPSAEVAFIKLLSRYHKTFINWNSTKLNSFFFFSHILLWRKKRRKEKKMLSCQELILKSTCNIKFRVPCTGNLSYTHYVPLLYFLNWNIVVLQCCVNFCCTEVIQLYIIHIYTYIHTHTHTHSFLYYFPLWFITRYWIQFPMVYSKILFIHSIYTSLYNICCIFLRWWIYLLLTEYRLLKLSISQMDSFHMWLHTCIKVEGKPYCLPAFP